MLAATITNNITHSTTTSTSSTHGSVVVVSVAVVVVVAAAVVLVVVARPSSEWEFPTSNKRERFHMSNITDLRPMYRNIRKTCGAYTSYSLSRCYLY